MSAELTIGAFISKFGALIGAAIGAGLGMFASHIRLTQKIEYEKIAVDQRFKRLEQDLTESREDFNRSINGVRGDIQQVSEKIDKYNDRTNDTFLKIVGLRNHDQD